MPYKNAIYEKQLYALNMQRSLHRKQYDDIDQYLQSLLRSNDHLLNMVSKLSYLTQSRLSAELGWLDVTSVIDEALDQLPHSMITIEKGYASGFNLYGDRTLLSECCTNIISNAVEAMDGQGTLTVTIEKVKRKVMIHFADNGRGMDKEQMKNLFDPFYSTKLKSGRNFGLGMFHIKKIMNAHHGKVNVTSQLGRGTVVTLVFPMEQRGG